MAKVKMTEEELLKKQAELEEKEKALEEKELNLAKEEEQQVNVQLEENRIALSTKEALDLEPKIPVRIPVSEVNPGDTDAIPVTINGYTYTIKRGEMVAVPQSVYMLLLEAKYI